jgi:hypothetical protein
MIHEQSVIVEFCGDDAIATLADIFKDPVDRYRALNLVMDVVGTDGRTRRADRRHVQALSGRLAYSGTGMARS